MLIISVAYILIGLGLFSAVFADEKLVVEKFYEKMAALSLIVFWPIWITCALLVILFSPILRVFFNIDYTINKRG